MYIPLIVIAATFSVGACQDKVDSPPTESSKTSVTTNSDKAANTLKDVMESSKTSLTTSSDKAANTLKDIVASTEKGTVATEKEAESIADPLTVFAAELDALRPRSANAPRLAGEIYVRGFANADAKDKRRGFAELTRARAKFFSAFEKKWHVFGIEDWDVSPDNKDCKPKFRREVNMLVKHGYDFQEGGEGYMFLDLDQLAFIRSHEKTLGSEIVKELTGIEKKRIAALPPIPTEE